MKINVTSIAYPHPEANFNRTKPTLTECSLVDNLSTEDIIKRRIIKQIILLDYLTTVPPIKYAIFNATRFVYNWDDTFSSYLAKKSAEGKLYNVRVPAH